VRRGFSTTVTLLVMSALFVLVLGAGAAFAQTAPTAAPPSYTPTTPAPTTSPPQTKATTPVKVVQAPPSSGLPRTGSSSSIPIAVVAAAMVAVGSVLAIAARRRSQARRPLG
jgi:LPXTG-motif cell wall-anchored protein